MNQQVQIDSKVIVALNEAEPEVRGTTLITYVVSGKTDL